MANYYEILGVPKDAKYNEIENAYSEKIKDYLHKLNDHSYAKSYKKLEEELTAINKAYKTISDPKLKTAYDKKIPNVVIVNTRKPKGKIPSALVMSTFLITFFLGVIGHGANPVYYISISKIALYLMAMVSPWLSLMLIAFLYRDVFTSFNGQIVSVGLMALNTLIFGGIYRSSKILATVITIVFDIVIVRGYENYLAYGFFFSDSVFYIQVENLVSIVIASVIYITVFERFRKLKQYD